MQEFKNKIQEEPFEVEVQYCDPDDCHHDCLVGVNYCDSNFMPIW